MIDSLYMTDSSLLSHTWCFEDRVIWIPIQPLAARVVGNYGEPKTKWDSYIIVYSSLWLLVSIYLIVHVNSLLFHENHIHSKVGSWHGFLLLKHMSPDTPLMEHVATVPNSAMKPFRLIPHLASLLALLSTWPRLSTQFHPSIILYNSLLCSSV